VTEVAYVIGCATGTVKSRWLARGPRRDSNEGPRETRSKAGTDAFRARWQMLEVDFVIVVQFWDDGSGASGSTGTE
jgi:hypothetical protein